MQNAMVGGGYACCVKTSEKEEPARVQNAKVGGRGRSHTHHIASCSLSAATTCTVSMHPARWECCLAESRGGDINVGRKLYSLRRCSLSSWVGCGGSFGAVWSGKMARQRTLDFCPTGKCVRLGQRTQINTHFETSVAARIRDANTLEGAEKGSQRKRS